MTHELYQAIQALCGGRGSSAPDPAAMELLIGSDPQEVLPELATALWRSHDRQQRNAASRVFLQLAARLPVISWPAMDQRLRTWVRFPDGELPDEKPSGLAGILRRLAKGPEPEFPSPAYVLIALCHHSGHIREKALPFAGQLPRKLAVCLLMLRANDWVPVIRGKAARSLAEFISLLDDRDKLGVLPLAAHLRACGRMDQRDLPDVWIQSLSQTEDEDAWLDAWRTAPQRQRRIYLSILHPERRLPGERLRRALLSNEDRLGMIFYLKEILPHVSPQEKDRAEKIASASRVVPVVRVWLEHYLRHSPAAALPRLMPLLSSRSRGLRDFARFHVSRLAPMDFKQHYLRLLDNSSDPQAALAGLVEVDPAAAHEAALERLHAVDPSIRSAVILALSSGWIEKNLSWAFSPQLWASPSGRGALRKRLGEIPLPVGSYALEHHQELVGLPEILRFIYSLITRMRKWDGLELLLLCCRDRKPDDGMEETLRKWLRAEMRSHVRLFPEQRQRLTALAASSLLDVRTVKYVLEHAE